jgi:uncharacterized protein (TIGR00369 family)
MTPLSARSASLTGLEHLQGIVDGTVPPAPIAETMGFELIGVEPGRALFAGTPTAAVYNPIGSVHGGFAATLLDSALGCSVQTELPAGVGYATLELSVNLVRGITAQTGRVLCEGRTIHVGRRAATAEARLTQEATGKLLAHGTTTCLVTDLSA